MTLWTPPGVKTHTGHSMYPPPDVVKLKGGALLKYAGVPGPAFPTDVPSRVYRGPQGLIVIVSLDDHGEPLGELLHVSLSVPRGYPDWDLIYAVTRAIFGEHVDAMMPIPREAAFIHGAVEEQRRGKSRQVFHVVECPQAWPREG